MLKKMPARIGFAFALVFVGFAFVGCDGLSPPKQAEAINVSQIKFKSLDGADFKLARHSQKPIILNVWATWCAPCIKELPSLLALHKQGDYALLTVSIDGDAAVVKNFLKQHNLSELPVVWDRGGAVIMKHIGLKGIPTTHIINTSQEIVGTEQGERVWDHPDMIAKIEKYLEEK